MPRANRHYIPGCIWHITHQSSPMASPRQVGVTKWINATLNKAICSREDKWTQSIAVDSKPFVEDTKRLLGLNGKGRAVRERDGSFELREPSVDYNPVFIPENVGLSTQNKYRWKAF